MGPVTWILLCDVVSGDFEMGISNNQKLVATEGASTTVKSYADGKPDGKFSATFRPIIAPLLKTPNLYMISLNESYYQLRYFASILNILAECFFFDSTSCV